MKIEVDEFSRMSDTNWK